MFILYREVYVASIDDPRIIIVGYIFVAEDTEYKIRVCRTSPQDHHGIEPKYPYPLQEDSEAEHFDQNRSDDSFSAGVKNTSYFADTLNRNAMKSVTKHSERAVSQARSSIRVPWKLWLDGFVIAIMPGLVRQPSNASLVEDRLLSRF